MSWRYRVILGFFLVPILSGCENNIVEFDAGSSVQTVKQAKGAVTLAPVHFAGVPLTCMASVLRPASFRSVQRRVLVEDGGYDFSNTAATIATNKMRIQVQPARHAVETEPAIYKTVIEHIPIKREHSELYGVPSSYQDAGRSYVLKPSYVRWKAGCLPASDQPSISESRINPCLEDVAAEQQHVARQLMRVPSEMHKKTQKTEYVAVERKVLVKAGKGSGTIPAQYVEIPVQYISKPWRVDVVRSQPRYQDITVSLLNYPAQIITLLSACEDKMPTSTIVNLQQKLNEQGQNIALTGRMDASTQQALLQFQQNHQLAQGALTLQTLRALGF